jgi:hypothetical protein
MEVLSTRLKADRSIVAVQASSYLSRNRLFLHVDVLIGSGSFT